MPRHRQSLERRCASCFSRYLDISSSRGIGSRRNRRCGNRAEPQRMRVMQISRSFAVDCEDRVILRPRASSQATPNITSVTIGTDRSVRCHGTAFGGFCHIMTGCVAPASGNPYLPPMRNLRPKRTGSQRGRKSLDFHDEQCEGKPFYPHPAHARLVECSHSSR